MTNAKMLGGALVGAAMAMTGCAGAAATGSSAALDTSYVPASIDGRTDLFLDPMLSRHLLTADEVNGSPTAVPVAVQITATELVAWRAGVPMAERTAADLVGHFQILGQVDVSSARVIDDPTTHRDQPGQVIPPEQIGDFAGGSLRQGPSSGPQLTRLPGLDVDFHINWTPANGIPNSVDVNTYHNVVGAHPGCA